MLSILLVLVCTKVHVCTFTLVCGLIQLKRGEIIWDQLT